MNNSFNYSKSKNTFNKTRNYNNEDNNSINNQNQNHENYSTANNYNVSGNMQTMKKSNNNLGNNNSMNSHLAFGKLIFQLLDKDKTGFVAKNDLLKEMDLDDQILNDLGFFSEENLLEC